MASGLWPPSRSSRRACSRARRISPNRTGRGNRASSGASRSNTSCTAGRARSGSVSVTISMLRVELAVAQALRQHRKRTGKNSDTRRSIAPVLNNTGAKADQAAVRGSARPQRCGKRPVGRPCRDVAAEAVNPKLNWPRKNFGRSKQTTASTPSLRTETKWLTLSFPQRPRWSNKRLSRRRPTSLQQVRRLGPSGLFGIRQRNDRRKRTSKSRIKPAEGPTARFCRANPTRRKVTLPGNLLVDRP